MRSHAVMQGGSWNYVDCGGDLPSSIRPLLQIFGKVDLRMLNDYSNLAIALKELFDAWVIS